MFDSAGSNANYTLDLTPWSDKIYNVNDNIGFNMGVESKVISPFN